MKEGNFYWFSITIMMLILLQTQMVSLFPPKKISHIKLPSSATRASPEREFTQSLPPIGREAASRWFTVFMLRWRPLYVTPGALLWAAWCLQPSRNAKSVINIDEILQPGFYSVRMLPWILNLRFLWALRTSKLEFIFYFQRFNALIHIEACLLTSDAINLFWDYFHATWWSDVCRKSALSWAVSKLPLSDFNCLSNTQPLLQKQLKTHSLISLDDKFVSNCNWKVHRKSILLIPPQLFCCLKLMMTQNNNRQASSSSQANLNDVRKILGNIAKFLSPVTANKLHNFFAFWCFEIGGDEGFKVPSDFPRIIGSQSTIFDGAWHHEMIPGRCRCQLFNSDLFPLSTPQLQQK